MSTGASGPDAVPIRLEHVTKRYAGSDTPAVDDVSLDVPAGETVVLLGPSGCGKTTTLKMINRLVEATSGTIFIAGQDARAVAVDELRRGIGYVIQQIGLFPHLDVAHNVGLLPKVLGWERSRIARRVDEMLSLVGLEPGSFRARFPKELSGGQQQRVGVARALAADPPVLLMDEPFGAIDPVTRARLQDELLGLQAQLRKTIVFVTHDIDEAVKMGDRVAIFEAGGRLAQYDLPDRVLAAPADAFVSGFVGRGTSLMRLRLRRVDELPVASWTVRGHADAPADLLGALRVADRPAGLVIDGEGRPRSWILRAQLENAAARVGGLDVIDGTPVRAVGPRASLADALDALLTSPARVAVVVDGNGAYRGVLDIGTLAASVQPESEPRR